MRRRQCGFVPVVDGLRTKRLVGVVTDRDILSHLVHLDSPPSRVAVRACMTDSSESIAPDASLEAAVRVMKQAAVRWLPVVAGGQLVGVLSLEDVALAAHRQWAYVGLHVTEQHVVEIIEAIAVDRARRTRRPAARRRHRRMHQ